MLRKKDREFLASVVKNGSPCAEAAIKPDFPSGAGCAVGMVRIARDYCKKYKPKPKQKLLLRGCRAIKPINSFM